MALFTHQEVPVTRVVARNMHRRKSWSRYSPRTFYLFIAPWIIGFLALTLLPLVYALILSFTDFDGISGHWHWIGLANYAELLHDPDLWYSLGRTLLFTVLAVPLSVAGGLTLAILLNSAGQSGWPVPDSLLCAFHCTSCCQCHYVALYL